MTFPGEWIRLPWSGSAPSGLASLPVSLSSGGEEGLVDPSQKALMFAMNTPSVSSSRLSSLDDSLPPKIDDSWESTSSSSRGSNAVPPRKTDWAEVGKGSLEVVPESHCITEGKVKENNISGGI